MLVLSRRPNECIVVGQDIRITVVEISGNRVKLGISAPAEVPIHREELVVKMHKAPRDQAGQAAAMSVS